MNKNYKIFLESDYWKIRRKKFISKTWVRCFLCRAKKNLHVHHKRYKDKYGSILYREKHTDFRLLCKSCHFTLHKHKLEKILSEGRVKRKIIRDLVKSLKDK